MEFSVKEIALWLQGEIVGDDTLSVNTLSKIEEGKSGSLSFLSNPKYTSYLYNTQASVVIVNADFVPEKPIDTTLIKVKDAYSAFATLLNAYGAAKEQQYKGISNLSFIDAKTTIGEDCYIGEFAYIGKGTQIGKNCKIFPQVYIGMNVVIADNTTIFSGVKIYEDCRIGSNCTIHSGVVIGADGFGFAPQEGNNYQKVAQIGNVVIEDHVEIGANTTVDRATMGSTIIRRGVKLDNLIQIAHNVEIGENTVVAAQSGVAGSTKVGKNCMIGGQVAIAGHLNIADGVKLAGHSGVAANIKENAVQMGSPSFEHKSFLQSYVHFRRLPAIVSKMEELEKMLQALQEKVEK